MKPLMNIYLKLGMTAMVLGLFGMIGFGIAGLSNISVMCGLVMVWGFACTGVGMLFMMWRSL